MDLYLANCKDLATTLFDMDQAAELARMVDPASKMIPCVPVRVCFLYHRGGIMPGCPPLDRMELPVFKPFSRKWVLHLEDGLMEPGGGISLVQKIIAMLLCALANAWDPSKGTEQWTKQNPRPVVKIVAIWSSKAAKQVMTAVSRFSDFACVTYLMVVWVQLVDQSLRAQALHCPSPRLSLDRA